jgi:hypothetical protein
VIPLATQGTSWMKKPYVKGMYPNPGTLHAWKFVYIEPDQSKWTSNMESIMTDNDPSVVTQLDQLMASQEQMKQQKANEQAAPKTTAE